MKFYAPLRADFLYPSGLLVFSISTAFFSIMRIPFSAPLPCYLDAAKEFLSGKTITDWHPVGYTFFLILSMKYFGLSGIFVFQSVLYILTILSVYFLLIMSKVEKKFCFLAGILIALHPFLFVNVKKITDANMAVILLLLFVQSLIIIERGRIDSFKAGIIGMLCGYMILVRTNYVSLMPVLFLILIFSKVKTRLNKIYLSAVILIVAIVTIGLINYALKKNVNPVDKYHRAIVFFEGANPYSYNEYIKNLTGENSKDKALAKVGLQFVGDSEDIKGRSRLTAIYFQQGLQFIKQNPLTYLKLIIIKAFTLFRPDYRQVYSSKLAPPALIVISQFVVALPFFIWILVMWQCWNINSYLDRKMICGIVILYILPFLFTTADPRYRLPLDVILIVDIVQCLYHKLYSRNPHPNSFSDLK